MRFTLLAALLLVVCAHPASAEEPPDDLGLGSRYDARDHQTYLDWMYTCIAYSDHERGACLIADLASGEIIVFIRAEDYVFTYPFCSLEESIPVGFYETWTYDHDSRMVTLRRRHTGERVVLVSDGTSTGLEDSELVVGELAVREMWLDGLLELIRPGNDTRTTMVVVVAFGTREDYTDPMNPSTIFSPL